ncbi:alpha/beta fold hydrolase [Acidovorax sp. NCPPB 4044]|uniref:alpha/beta fold hydrolase n=1 Tax=Acidovorax sp. NCPPB 4044 TaxID=2940490 RepID=UPI0023039B33|nr:alpha/beta hydrolase [Acidovorax sp. NCPPB 4044]MDA8523540.1 alpha/beta hydrolase [Acidovorax sp. NCPPB 4044]
MNAPSTAPPHPAAEFRDDRVCTPRGRLFVRRWGAPPPSSAGAGSRAATPAEPHPAPIVLFHDSLGCVALWRDFPDTLCRATGRDVIAYDRLGFGRSDARTGPLPFDFVEEEARTSLPALRAHLGVQRFVALGHSVGGAMAVHCAAAAPGDCEALVTIAAQATVEERTRQGIREARDQFHANPGTLDRLARYHGEAQARWALNAWVDTWLHPDFAEWSLESALARVACPVLALHGDQDGYGSTAQPGRIAQWAGGPARVEILPGAGHVPHREQPADLATRIARFLAGPPAGAGR